MVSRTSAGRRNDFAPSGQPNASKNYQCSILDHGRSPQNDRRRLTYRGYRSPTSPHAVSTGLPDTIRSRFRHPPLRGLRGSPRCRSSVLETDHQICRSVPASSSGLSSREPPDPVHNDEAIVGDHLRMIPRRQHRRQPTAEARRDHLLSASRHFPGRSTFS